jgi:hypothetical protein
MFMRVMTLRTTLGGRLKILEELGVSQQEKSFKKTGTGSLNKGG